MSHPLHRRIAIRALERGLLSLEQVCDAMVELGQRGEGGLAMWLEEGRLDQAHLAQVLHELGVLADVLVRGEEHGQTTRIDGRVVALQSVEADLSPDADEASLGIDARMSDQTSEGFESNFSRTRTLMRDTDGASPQNAGGRPVALEADAMPAEARYLIGDELGRGGGGRVVRAFDRIIGRSVAMKILSPPAEAHSAAHRRFLAEVQATGQLEHPNIVPVYDFGTLRSGEVFYTMREVRRHSLRDALRGLKRGEPHHVAEYTLVRLVTILRQVALAIDYAHQRGVVHRDLKPDNIMLGDYGEVLVMDWGLARVLERQSETQGDASSAVEESGHTLGTPAYMSPEQARGELENVDELSDVYSLGAILYEILTLQPPYVGEDPREVMWKVVEEPLLVPTRRAPERPIPSLLEHICIKAMASARADRHGSAREFHEELEDWIEGIQAQEARRKVKRGSSAAARFRALRERVVTLDDEVRRRAAQIEGWESVARKREVWQLEDERDRCQAESARAFGDAVAQYTQALAYQPSNADAKQGLATLYWERLEQARAMHQVADEIYFEAMVRQYDTGHYVRMLDSQSIVRLTTSPPGADVRMYRFEEVDRRLRPVDERHLGRTPLEIRGFADGAYLLVIEHDERLLVRQPLVLDRGRSWALDVYLPPAEHVADGFVYIPGGEFIAGGDPEAFDPRRDERVHLDGFCCARFPVTFRQYLEMINELYQDDPQLALARAPQTRGAEGLLVRFDEERRRWVPDEILIEGPARRAYPVGEGHEDDIPVVGIRHEDAVAYCQWLARRDGRPYRLPTELELEKAGRGVDGRFFPWGSRFDPTFCKMRFSRPELPQLEPIGVFEDDCSPYGVRDLGGGVQEWCQGSGNDLVDRPIKGGGWNQDMRASRLASRVQILAAARTAGIGMRLAYDLPRP